MKLRKEPELVVSILDAPGKRLLGRAIAEPDFDPICQAAWLNYVRRNGAAPPVEEAELRPVWSKSGEPFVSGVTAAVPPNGGAAGEATAGLEYFAPLAKAAASRLVRQGVMEANDSYLYLVSVNAAEKTKEEESTAAVEVTPELNILTSALPEFLARASNTQAADGDDIPVFIRPEVLEETAGISLDAGEVEIGGLLLGHMRWDPEVPELFLEITAQVKADAEGTQARLRFTPEVWHRARETAESRERDETILGWWHAHNWPVKLDEFSLDDHVLHRSLFSRSTGQGLLVTTSQERTAKHFLYGWRGGIIQSRGYYLLGGDDDK